MKLHPGVSTKANDQRLLQVTRHLQWPHCLLGSLETAPSNAAAQALVLILKDTLTVTFCPLKITVIRCSELLNYYTL